MSEPMRLSVEALGHWAIAWTIVVLAVVAWLGVARPRRAAVRYTGWLLATFAGAALAPVVLAVGPLTSWRQVLRVTTPRPDTSGPTAASRSWFDGEPTTVVPDPIAQQVEDAPGRAEAGPRVGSARQAVPARSVSDGRPSWDRWRSLAVGLWAAGVLLMGSRLAWSALRIRALLAGSSSALPEGLGQELESSRRELGIRRPVRIVIHPAIGAPMCVGLLRPLIFWPAPENCPMSPRQRLASLTHELAHLRHGDDVLALLAEAWRALAWFYPPVHLAVARLRREREYRCDDLAAAKLDAPEQYAEWLLDLAPVRVAPPVPFLAASLRGETSLADRVRRILRGEARSATPLGRGARAFLVLSALSMLGAAGSVRLVGLVDRGTAQGPADAPLPPITPAELAAKIREAMGRYDDKGLLRVLFTRTQDTNFRFMMNQGKAEEQAPILVSFRGRARHESDGVRWRAEYDSMMPSSGSTELSPDRWSTGFDGTRTYDWLVSRNQFTLGVSNLSARQWTPRGIIWERSEELVLMLGEPDHARVSVSIAQRVVDGTSCYVVAVKGLVDPDWGGETVLSPRQGYLPIARKWTLRGKTYSSHVLQGVHEVVPGIWAPDRIEDESITVRKDGASRVDSRLRVQVVEYRPRQTPPAATFELKIPYGVDVVDFPQGSTYHNDPWWPEVGPMLREKFGWPRPDFSLLKTLGSSSERKLDGQPAPPLRIARWLNTEPLDLASLRGKVVLVEFGDLWNHYGPRYAAALRELHAAYHPAGLEILSIHAPAKDEEADEIRRFAKDYRLPYPVVMDEGKPGTAGVTAEAFAIRGRICAFLIDHEGKVHSAGESTVDGGRLVETVVSLLQASGARDVKAVSLEIPRLPDAAFQDADKLFNARAKEALAAHPDGKIAGRIVDGDGRPIAGAGIQASLQFTMLQFAMPGGYFTIGYRGPAGPFGGSSDADGRFDIAGLCKGGYLVRASAPGRAWSERKLFIGPSFEPASVEFVLDQGDSISGRVRDPQGNPIAGASVTPTEREHREGDYYRSTRPAGPAAVKTDDAGQFRFNGIQEGRYILEIKAAGFKDRELEPIPAGDGNVEVTLEPSS